MDSTTYGYQQSFSLALQDGGRPRVAYYTDWAGQDLRYLEGPEGLHAPALSPGRGGQFVLTPNPARESVHVRFSLLRSETARLELLDDRGRRVIAKPLGVLAPGSHEVTLTTRELASGVYWLRLGGAGRAAVPMCVIR
jgi:hypothetical protein